MRARPGTQELNRKVESCARCRCVTISLQENPTRSLVTQVADFNTGDEILPGEPRDTCSSCSRQGSATQGRGLGPHLGRAHISAKCIDSANTRASVSAAAEDRTRALVLRRRDFNDIIRNEPRLSVKLLWSFVQVLAERPAQDHGRSHRRPAGTS